MQTRNRFFDDLARVVTGAAGAAQGVRAEVETALRLRMERAAQELDLASREDVAALRDLLAAVDARLEALEARLAALEAPPAEASGAGSGAGARKGGKEVKEKKQGKRRRTGAK